MMKLLEAINSRTLSVKEMLQQLSLSGRDNFLKEYLYPSIEQGFIAIKYPQSPNHPKQRYYLTEQGIMIKNK